MHSIFQKFSRVCTSCVLWSLMFYVCTGNYCTSHHPNGMITLQSGFVCLFAVGKAVDMSFDHKPTDKVELDRITNAGGHVGLDCRVNGGLNLSRAIGKKYSYQF